MKNRENENVKQSAEKRAKQHIERNTREIYVQTPEIHHLLNVLSMTDRSLRHLRLNMFGKIDGQAAVALLDRWNNSKKELEEVAREINRLAGATKKASPGKKKP